jgi:putative NIF3 family GTP cyclohydrolase 1 type 2
MSSLSRRQFVQMAGAGLAAGSLAQIQAQGQKGKLTAGEVVERIKKNQGVPWDDSTYRDTFKIGGPDSVVTGICSVFEAHISVMQKALKAGLNMIINHEPTFWTDGDIIGRVQDDPLYRWKLDFAKRNNIVVWRNHDHIHKMRPSPFGPGTAKTLGWTSYETPGGYTIPPTTLNELAKYIAKALQLRSVRVIGDPNLQVSKISSGRGMEFAADTDCKIANDIREWDAFEYARDTIFLGQKKGLIVISHEASEEGGMAWFAEWLKPLIPEVPVQYIPTGCDFWTV